MSWKKLLESASESLNDHLRLRNEYLLAENRILRNQIEGRVQLTDNERKELAEMGAKLGKQALEEIATIAKPDTILAWNRTFADQQVDTSEPPKSVGRPRVAREIEGLVLRMAQENRSWGYDRLQGALKHLGSTISDQTVGNILKRHGLLPAPQRKKTVTWREFVRIHMDLLGATDFFTSEVWSWCGFVISCLLSFIHCSCHYVHSAGMTLHRRTRMVGFFVLHALKRHAQIQRWGRWITTRAQSGAIRWGQGLLCNTIAEFSPSEGRQPHTPDMSKVVLLPVVTSRPIRDGPVRRTRELVSALDDHQRQAA